MRNLTLLLAAIGIAKQVWAYVRDRLAPELSCMARSLSALVYGYLATTMLGLLVAGGFLIATRLGLSDGVRVSLGPYLVFAVQADAPGRGLNGGVGLILVSALVGFIAAVVVRIRCSMEIRRQAIAREKRRAATRRS
ncbi:MAG: hypothetical protein Kow0047_06840 [Anaerolineae bacterium]